MARVRQLKPDFFKDEDLASVSHAARLLFQGLWTLADRSGRLEERPLKLKAELFPYEAVDVEALLTELARPKRYGHGALIERYEVEGRNYIQVNGFEKHQHCHPKEPPSMFPPPEPRPAAAGNGRAAAGNGEQAASTSVPSVPSESKPSESTELGLSPGYGEGVVGGGAEPGELTASGKRQFADAVWQAWQEKRGPGGPLVMSIAEFDLLSRWMADPEVPLRIVLRGIEECGGKPGPRTTLLYARPSVEQAIAQWARSRVS